MDVTKSVLYPLNRDCLNDNTMAYGTNGRAQVTLLALLALLALILPLSQGADWNQGSIRLDPDEDDHLTPTGSPIKTGFPGSEIYFTLWVTNDHSKEQRVLLSVADGPDWTIAVTGSVDVPAGERRSVDLYVSVPDEQMDPTKSYPIRIEGIANLTMDRASLNAMVELDISIDHKLTMLPNNVNELSLNVYPGQNTFADIGLENRGNMKDTYEVRILEHQLSWDIRFREGSEELEVPLGHSDTDDRYKTSLMIKVPYSATAGHKVDIEIYSLSTSSENYGVGKRSDLVTIQIHVIKGSSISVVPLDKGVVECQDHIETSFRLIHSGVTDAVLDPVISVSSGGDPVEDWVIMTAPAGPFVFDVGDEMEVSVRAVPPERPFGYFELEFGGSSSMAEVSSSTITAFFEPVSDLLLGDISGAPFDVGKEISISTTVSNRGDLSEQAKVDVFGVPEGYIVEIAPSKNMYIGPNETIDLMIKLTPMEDDMDQPFDLELSLKMPVDDLGGQWREVGSGSIRVDFRELPDLELKGIDIPVRTFDEGSLVHINITVANVGNLPVRNATLVLKQITFGLSNPEIDRRSVDLGAGEQRTLCFEWKAQPAARSIRARIFVPEGQEEMSHEDNEKVEPIYVIPTKVDRDASPEGEETAIPAGSAIAGGAGLVLVTGLLVFITSKDIIRYPLFLAMGPLYSKLRPEHILNNRLRKRIYVYVQNHPGEHFRSILTHLDLTNGTLAHHLHTLEKESLIRSQRDGLYRRFYPAGYKIDEKKVSLSAIQSRIMELVLEEPGLSQKEISQKLKLSNSTVNYNIKSLADKGMVGVEKEGKSTSILPIRDRNN